MPYQRRINPVQRSLSRPLTILGAERKLFFFAMCLGAATFNLLGSLLGGVLMFLLLYFVARWATATDPLILRLLLRAAKLRSQYDPAKLSPIVVTRASSSEPETNLQKLRRCRIAECNGQSVRLCRSAGLPHQIRRSWSRARTPGRRLRMPRRSNRRRSDEALGVGASAFRRELSRLPALVQAQSAGDSAQLLREAGRGCCDPRPHCLLRRESGRAVLLVHFFRRALSRTHGAPFYRRCHSGISCASGQNTRRSSGPVFWECKHHARCARNHARGICPLPEDREFSRPRERLRAGDDPREGRSIRCFEAYFEL